MKIVLYTTVSTFPKTARGIESWYMIRNIDLIKIYNLYLKHFSML
jgi:hypothetical protein